VAVKNLSGATAIAAGAQHTCALKKDGTVACWGYNYLQQLGDGSQDDATTPVAVKGLSGVTAIATGSNHVCALKKDGTASCWGHNYQGQLGDGTSKEYPPVRASPVAVKGLAGINSIAAGGQSTCALKNDGVAMCWGYNYFGQLGIGSLVNKSLPTTVLGFANTKPCSDGDLCTTNHRCASGKCASGKQTSCDDKDKCTTDSCNKADGKCAHSKISGCSG
jgi:alpha-tubulin suppressor-like RCC1 family protein